MNSRHNKAAGKKAFALPAVILLIVLLLACNDRQASPTGRSVLVNRFIDQNEGHMATEKGIQLLDSFYATLHHPDRWEALRYYNYKQWYYFYARRDYTRGMLYADSILAIYKDKDMQEADIAGYDNAMLLKGDVYLFERRYNDAFLYFYQGMQIIQRSGDTCQFNEFSSRLALSFYKQGKYLEAIPYFKKAYYELSYCRQSDSFHTFLYQQGQLDNIALSFDHSEMTDSAIFYYDSTLNYIRQHKHLVPPKDTANIQTAMAVVYGNKADALLKTGDSTGAEVLYQQSLSINEKKQYDPWDAQLTKAKLAKLYIAQNKFGKAALTLEQLRMALDTNGRPDGELSWRQAQWQLFHRTGQTQQAYNALQSFVQLSDSLNPANNPLYATDMNREFERLSREYELATLKKKDELKSLYLVISITLIVMAVVIVVLILYNMMRYRRHMAEQQRLNDRIVEQNEAMSKNLYALEQSEQQKSKIMKIVAHDLRNPVGAIFGLADLVMLSGRLDREDAELISLIQTSATNALNLITNLLQMDIGNPAEIHKEPIDIHSALKYCTDLLQPKASQKGQTLLLHAKPVELPASRDKLWRVFSNLIDNAIKFSPLNGIITITSQKQNDKLVVSIKDEGIGIPIHLRSTIFSSPAEAKRTGTKGEESFGLGLDISKQIVEAHGGKIWFDSEDGKGTTFYVELNLQ